MAFGSFGSGNNQPMAEINMTPLVDVMLVLLIIFMVTAPMLQTGVDVNLPQAKAQTIPDDEGKLILTVTKDKRVFLGKLQIPWDDVEKTLKNNAKLHAYPLATKDAASKMLVWDGPILQAFGWNAPTCNVSQCDWWITWGYANPCSWTNWWADPDLGFTNRNNVVPPATNRNYYDPNRSSPNYIGVVNVDGGAADYPWNMPLVGHQRYRHLQNTSANFLYFDGHVESKKMGEVRYVDISLFPY